MVKYKCFKTQCPACGNTGSLQLFLNKQNEVKYGRVRHIIHKGETGYNPNIKYNFHYCKIENLQQLETLLKSLSLKFPTSTTQLHTAITDTNLKPLGQAGLISKINGAGSSARIEHHPPKPSNNIDPKINWEEYREYLLSKFSRSYALQVYNNGLRHYDCLDNPQNISILPISIRSNILKAMVNLAKYLGCYEQFKVRLRNHGVKWVNQDDSFNSFLRIVNNNHSNLGEWYNTAQSILRENEKLWLKFTLLTGLRKQEAINSFNLIMELSQQNKLSEYYNKELEILEHFKYADLFLRATKKVYISIVSKKLISKIVDSKPVSYSAIRKRLTRNKQHIRFKELRSYFATFLRNNGILAEYVDLLQGRIPKSVFARHYLKVEDVKKLVLQVLAKTENLEKTLIA
jgi:intergrase/recombinase